MSVNSSSLYAAQRVAIKEIGIDIARQIGYFDQGFGALLSIWTAQVLNCILELDGLA
jgi:hypothetical protein